MKTGLTSPNRGSNIPLLGELYQNWESLPLPIHAVGGKMSEQGSFNDLLNRIEILLTQMGKRPKEWYTTAETAEILGRAEYTVREWCRQGRVPEAEKADNGRNWRISHEGLERLRNRGPLPIPKHKLNGLADRAGD